MREASAACERGAETGARRPTVSVGVPVHNGGDHLALALESLLAQTFSDYEAIVSDNASTDGTQEICEAYAQKDRRIRYHRTAENLGAAANFNRVFWHSRGQYFKWLAHDDVMAPGFLSACVRALEADAEVVLAHPRVEIIDAVGGHVRNFDLRLPKTGSSRAHERFADLVRHDRFVFEIFGLIRSEALVRTLLVQSFVGSDRILRAELGLLGRFCEVPERLMRSRDHAGRSVRALPAHHMRGEWFDPANRGRTLYPHWRILWEYLLALNRSSVSVSDKRRCYLRLARWLTHDVNWGRLVADLAIAARPTTWSFFSRLAGSEDWLEGQDCPDSARNSSDAGFGRNEGSGDDLGR